MLCNTCVLAAALLTSSVVPQITSTTVDIGGPNTKGLQGGDPPTLSDGSDATATITYTFDNQTGKLTIDLSPRLIRSRLRIHLDTAGLVERLQRLPFEFLALGPQFLSAL